MAGGLIYSKLISAGVCVSSALNADPQYREVKGHSTSRVVKTKYYTKCFYNSKVDKKQIVGLLAKGNKAKYFVNKGVKVPTKIYRPTNNKSIVSSMDTTCDTSSGGVDEVSLHGDRVFTPRAHVNECVNECVSMQDNSMRGDPLHNNCVGITDTDTNTYYHGNDRKNQVPMAGDKMLENQMVEVFDINAASDDKFLNTLLSKQQGV